LIKPYIINTVHKSDHNSFTNTPTIENLYPKQKQIKKLLKDHAICKVNWTPFFKNVNFILYILLQKFKRFVLYTNLSVSDIFYLCGKDYRIFTSTVIKEI